MDDEFFCTAMCGCAGAQPASTCMFDPNCTRCAQFFNTFTEEEAAQLLQSMGFEVVEHGTSHPARFDDPAVEEKYGGFELGQGR